MTVIERDADKLYAMTVNYLRVSRPTDAQLGRMARAVAQGQPLGMIEVLWAADEIEDRLDAAYRAQVVQRATTGRQAVVEPPARLTAIAPGAYTVVLDGGTRWVTFRVLKSRDARYPDPKLQVLTGPDNELSYTSIGRLKSGRVQFWSDAHWLSSREDVKRALPTLLALDDAGLAQAGETYSRKTEVRDDNQVLLSVRCYRCSRLLTVPDSINRGKGPDCAAQS